MMIAVTIHSHNSNKLKYNASYRFVKALWMYIDSNHSYQDDEEEEDEEEEVISSIEP